jgi:aminoglycoside phosphotransferase (APT) family kinase protein
MNPSLGTDTIKAYLAPILDCTPAQVDVSQLAGGFSNLSFTIQTPDCRVILRRPPFGEKIAKAHDMVREYAVLQGLKKAGYTKSPQPLHLCEDETVFGAPFFLMEFVEGIVLRNKVPAGLAFGTAEFEALSKNAVGGLIELHQLELQASGLIDLGKPEGYTARQVQGWTERYLRAKTNEFAELEVAATWLQEQLPATEPLGFLHNDYKYDNLVLNPHSPTQISAVLDWEMATIGNPLMDLGTTLAYWAEEADPTILKLFNLSHLPGNLRREELLDLYFSTSRVGRSEMLYYYVFGLFKVATIAQQIYKRYSQGFANDPRFAQLIHVVEAAGKKAIQALQTDKI